MQNASEVADRIKAARKARGWDEWELARRTGLSFRTIFRLESGTYRAKPNKATQILLALKLRVPVEDLFPTGDEEAAS